MLGGTSQSPGVYFGMHDLPGWDFLGRLLGAPGLVLLHGEGKDHVGSESSMPVALAGSQARLRALAWHGMAPFPSWGAAQ